MPSNTTTVIQNMFSITSKTIYAVNIVLGSLINKLFGVINDPMLTKVLQRLITSKGSGKVNRALAGMVLDMVHESPRRDRLHHLGVGPAVPLQEAKEDAFTSCTSPSCSIPLDSYI